MSVSLQKGQKISLTKDNAGLARVIVGLGWDEAPRKRKGLFGPKPEPIDCDASAIMLQDGKLKYKNDVVYFGNLKHDSNTVIHTGDNLTGAGEGDDEQIIVDLQKMPNNYDRIVIVVNIYQAFQRQQHFGMIKNAFIRIVDEVSGEELIRYDLGEDFSIETAVVVGEIYRHCGEWKFNAIGSGFQGGLAALCGHYGIEVA